MELVLAILFSLAGTIISLLIALAMIILFFTIAFNTWRASKALKSIATDIKGLRKEVEWLHRTVSEKENKA